MKQNKSTLDKFSNQITRTGPVVPIYFSVIYIIVILVITWLIDFERIFIPGLSDWVNQFPAPIFWLQVNREAGLTENLQWLFLFISLISCLLVMYVQRGTWNLPRVGLLFLCIGIAIMFLEDVFNIRHALSWYLSSFFYEGHVGSYEWRTSTFRSVVEIMFYAFLGSIMMIAFLILFFGRETETRTKVFLIGGYLFYGVASFASATRNIGDWYARAGKSILDPLLDNRNTVWDAESIIFYRDPISFWFMDLLVEESLELLGSAFLLSVVLSILARLIATRQLK